MDKTTMTVAKKLLKVEEEEPITVLKLQGFHDCPLADDQGIVNCPLGFEHIGVPTELQPWMRGACEDESWRERWREILACCQKCRGNPKPTSEEAEVLSNVYEILAGGQK